MTQLVLASNAQLRLEFPGSLVVPDTFIEKFFRPAATNICVKYAPTVDVDSEVTEFVIVLAGAGLSVGQLQVRRYRKKQATESVERQTIDVTPIRPAPAAASGPVVPPYAPKERSWQKQTGSFDMVVEAAQTMPSQAANPLSPP